MSDTPATPIRRSARLIEKADAPAPAPVEAPAAPKKARAPKQPSAAELARAERYAKFEADSNTVSQMIDDRIRMTFEDLAVLKRINYYEDYNYTLIYLFENLFGSNNFSSLGRHRDYTDQMFALVAILHTNYTNGSQIAAELFTSCRFVKGWSKIVLFLSEVGYPTNNMVVRRSIATKERSSLFEFETEFIA